MQLHPGTAEQLSVAFDPPPRLPDGLYYTVKPWLIWRGNEPLQLLHAPELY